MDLNNENLKQFAVKAVTQFVSKGIPLNRSVASIAEQNKLNPDQIKRLIEASNQIAYLNLLDKAKDRTFEFPVADYEGVLGLISGQEGQEKQASTSGSAMDIFFEPLEKAAQETPEDFRFSKEATLTYAWKSIQANKAELEKLAHKEAEILMGLGTQGKVFGKDPLCLNKLAQVADEDTFSALSRLLNRDTSGFEKGASFEVFKDKDLDGARELVYLYKEAKETVQHRKAIEASLEKAAGIIGSSLGAVAGGLGEVAGAGVGAGAGLAVKGVTKGVKGFLKGTKNMPFSKLDLLAGVGYKPTHSVWDSLHSN